MQQCNYFCLLNQSLICRKTHHIKIEILRNGQCLHGTARF